MAIYGVTGPQREPKFETNNDIFINSAISVNRLSPALQSTDLSPAARCITQHVFASLHKSGEFFSKKP